jgi:bifunctional UDP-N-acetylglucosamine pyrophosphorylase / glucosamine-1-phosphate N-acetyltransferase
MLMNKGVQIPNPESVEIGHDIEIERISGDKVVIHAGCKIFGRSTLISKGTVMGFEGPATLVDCQVGPGVRLNSGFFQKSVFLKGVSIGSGSHIREGAILEEEASVAHTVGLKQTILFPWVTLGSLINFCDCFMSGGTSRKDHSEVGSSYIHFNYTPNQDKATPSLIGDVPRGVMLNQPPIFLGGQGGLVGPCRLGFGTVIAAGSICRKDELRSGRLIFEGRPRGGNLSYSKGIPKGLKRILINNFFYIANQKALLQWYDHIRRLFVSEDFPEALLKGLLNTLHSGIEERINQLGKLVSKLAEYEGKHPDESQNVDSFLVRQKHEFILKWPELENVLHREPGAFDNPAIRDDFVTQIDGIVQEQGKDYLSVIKGLSPEKAQQGSQWLQGIVDGLVSECLRRIPAFV